MSVYNGEIVVVILLTDKAAGVLTEGAHFVLEGTRIADEFGFVKNLVYLLHDLVAHLDAHADVDRSRVVSNVVLGAEMLEPVGAAATRRDDGMLCFHVIFDLAVGDARSATDGIF